MGQPFEIPIPESSDYMTHLLESASRPNPNCLSQWYPKIKAAGLPVPRTTIITMPPQAMREILTYLDGRPSETSGWIQTFADVVAKAGSELGVPFFLRTGLTSNKHNWRETCFVANPEQVATHITSLAEFSISNDLAWNVWVVREMLPTIPIAFGPSYSGMPLCREVRLFVNNGAVVCGHPYWPQEAVERSGADNVVEVTRRLSEYTMEEWSVWKAMAEAASRACEGAWSIDLLETTHGWFVTDMARAHESWHNPNCPNSQYR